MNAQTASQGAPIPTTEMQGSRDPRRTTEQNNPDDRSTSTRSGTTSSGEPFISRKPSNLFLSPGKQSHSSSNDQNTSLDTPKAWLAGKDKWTDTVGSVTSLSSFPSPPTHVPMPPTSVELDAQLLESRSLPAQSQATPTSPRPPPLSESPMSWGNEVGPSDAPPLREEPTTPQAPCDDLTTPTIVSVASNSQENSNVGPGPGESAEYNTLTSGQNISVSYPSNGAQKSPALWSQPIPQSLHIPDAPQGIEKSSSAGLPSSTDIASPAAYKQQEGYQPDEFGVDRSERYGQLKSKSINAVKLQGLERNTSSGSIVAAMRNRYTNVVCLFLSQLHVIVTIYRWIIGWIVIAHAERCSPFASQR